MNASIEAVSPTSAWALVMSVALEPCERGPVDVAHPHVRAVGREQFGGRQPDSGGPGRHDHAQPVQFDVHPTSGRASQSSHERSMPM